MYYITKYESGNIYIEEDGSEEDTVLFLAAVKIENVKRVKPKGCACSKQVVDILKESESLDDIVTEATMLAL